MEPLPYVSRGKPGPKKRIPQRDVNVHANFLKRKFKEAYTQSLTQNQVAAIQYKEGTYLEFSSAQRHDLIVKSLENLTLGIRLLNVRTAEETETIRATVYIPNGKESFFINKVEKYLESYADTGKPRFNELISSIEDVKLAFLDAFWIGKKEDMPTDTPVWCEVWLRVEDVKFDEVESSFSTKCEELGIQYDEKSIKFPERLIKLIYATAVQLGELISRYANIAEIRRAPEIASFFEELNFREQREWADELLSRLDYDFSNAAVCILDTGVSSGHPLLSLSLDDDTAQSVEATWGNHDHDGHGTEMAGIALYHNLQDRILSPSRQRIVHHLESVKILPPRGENDPKLYGAITHRAVYLAEISRPHIERAVCMAVTSDRYNTNDGSPTSWSGAVDSITSGAIDSEEKRLFFISAGNVYPSELSDVEYPTANSLHSVENPGQAWNAITVGAYSHAVRIKDELMRSYRAVADSGELSPYSSTSVMWNKRWPIKPEILCDGGNLATNGTD